MNDHEPSEGVTPNIFAQLEQVYIDLEVDDLADHFEFDITTLQYEAKVLDLIALQLPKYADAMKMIKNKQILLDEFLFSLNDIVGSLPAGHEIFGILIEARQVLFTAAQLASEYSMQEMQPENHSKAREYQLKIMFDDDIAEDDKSGLLEVTRMLLNGDGIDTSNADDMLMAIADSDQQQKRLQFERDTRVKARELFEYYLDTTYNLVKADPEYKGLVTFVSRHIATRVTSTVYKDADDGSTGTFTLELLIETPVSALGLNKADIIRASQQIVEQLTTSD